MGIHQTVEAREYIKAPGKYPNAFVEDWRGRTSINGAHMGHIALTKDGEQVGTIQPDQTVWWRPDRLDTTAEGPEKITCPEGYGLVYGEDCDVDAVQRVLDGNVNDLVDTFDWDYELHGGSYWADRDSRRHPLSDTDLQFLRYLLTEHEESSEVTCPEGYGTDQDLNKSNVQALRDVLDGESRRLMHAFTWRREAHGHNYWRDRRIGDTPLSDADLQFLRFLLARHEAPSDECPDGYSYDCTDDVDPEALKRVVDGDHKSLPSAFLWTMELNGHWHWSERACGMEPLSDTDLQFLRYLRAEVTKCPESYRLDGGVNSVEAIRDVLNGYTGELDQAFRWTREAHGEDYWSARYEGEEPLTADDKQFLRHLLAKSAEAV